MLISKNNRVEKVSLRNVKAFIPRRDSCDTISEENKPYSLRKRKSIVNYERVQIARISLWLSHQN